MIEDIRDSSSSLIVGESTHFSLKRTVGNLLSLLRRILSIRQNNFPEDDKSLGFGNIIGPNKILIPQNLKMARNSLFT